jgi:hypothetical protein
MYIANVHTDGGVDVGVVKAKCLHAGAVVDARPCPKRCSPPHLHSRGD